MIKKLFSHSVIYGLAPHIPRIAGIFSLPIITSHLTEVDFGVYGIVTAIVEGLAIFMTLGLNVNLTNAFYKNPGQFRWAWRQIYGFLIIWSFPYSLILGGILFVFIPIEAKKDSLLIIISNVLPTVLFGAATVLGRTYYQLKQKPLQIAIRSILVGFLTVALNIYFIAELRLGYMGWFFSVCISQIVLQASYLLPLVNKIGITPIFNYKRRFIKDKLKIGLPTVPHYYGAYLLNSSDRFLMGILGVNIGDIGVYNAANTVGGLVQKAGLAAGQAMGPMMYQAYKDDKESDARKLVFFAQVAFFVGTLLLSLWMKEIFAFLIKNPTLQSGYSIAIIIAMSHNYRPMYFGANNRLFYLEKTKSLPKITLVAGVLCVILNVIFIPLYGYQVAAFSMYIALMYMGYSGFFFKDFKNHSSVPYYPLAWFLTTIACTVFSYWAVELTIVYKVLFCFLILLIGGFAMLKIAKSK